MRIRRHAIHVIAVLSAAVLLVACGGGGSEATSTTSDGSEAPATSGDGGSSLSGDVVVWTLTWSETDAASWDAMVAEFEDLHPGVTVTTETRGTDEHKDALRQAAGTDAAPDIYRYWTGSGLGGELVNLGVSRDISDFYEQYGWDDRFTGAALAGVTQYGGHHGVPHVQPGEAIYYSKALFEQAGVTDLPTTYEELVAVADQLVAAGITPIEFGGTVGWDVMRLLDSQIETLCGAETGDSLNIGDGDWSAEPCVTEAFTELQNWSDEYILEGFMAMSNADSEQQFYAGNVAMALEGSWFETFIVDNGMDVDNIGLFQFPTGTGRLYGFGEAWYITETSENAEAAAAFLDFISSEDGLAVAGDTWPRLGVYADFDASGASELTQTWAELFNDAQGIYINNDQNFSTVVTTEYWRIQNSVILGDISPADAGAEFQEFREANQ
jgi:raffinose/stachyose/melibiose transport system substrate-binding protein